MSSIHSLEPTNFYWISCAPLIQDPKNRKEGSLKGYIRVEDRNSTIGETRRLIAAQVRLPFEEVYIVTDRENILRKRDFVRIDYATGVTHNAYLFEDDERWSDQKIDKIEVAISKYVKIYFGKKMANTITLHPSPLQIPGHTNPLMQEAIILAKELEDATLYILEANSDFVKKEAENGSERQEQIEFAAKYISRMFHNTNIFFKSLVDYVENHPELKLLPETKSLLETANKNLEEARRVAASLEKINGPLSKAAAAPAAPREETARLEAPATPAAPPTLTTPLIEPARRAAKPTTSEQCWIC